MDGDVHLWQVQFPVTAETSIPVQCNRALPPGTLPCDQDQEVPASATF